MAHAGAPEASDHPGVPDVSGPLLHPDLSVHSLFYGVYDVSGGWGVEHPYIVNRHFGVLPIRRMQLPLGSYTDNAPAEAGASVPA
jgi:hypothetical protein